MQHNTVFLLKTDLYLAKLDEYQNRLPRFTFMMQKEGYLEFSNFIFKLKVLFNHHDNGSLFRLELDKILDQLNKYRYFDQYKFGSEPYLPHTLMGDKDVVFCAELMNDIKNLLQEFKEYLSEYYEPIG